MHGGIMIFFKTAQVFILKVLIAFLGFFLQVQLGRLLGMDGYGSFSLFLSLASVISIFPTFGMDSGLIREVAATDSLGKRKWCVLISLVYSVILLIMLGMIIPFVFPYLSDTLSLSMDMLPLLISYLAVLVLNTLAGAVLQGEQRNVMNDGTVVLTSSCKVIFIYYLSGYKVGIHEIFMTYIILDFLSALGRWGNIFYRYRDIEVEWQPLLEMKKYFRYCLPLFFVSSIGIVQYSLHRFVTAYFMDSYSVGVLRVCENFSSALSLFIAPFVTTWPLMAAYYKDGRLDDIRKMFEETSVIITVLIMPALISILVCAPELFQLFHLSAIDNPSLIVVLFVFCLGTVYDAIVGPAGALLKMTEYSRVAFYNSTILLLLTMIFSCVLIPMFGLLGAAGAFSMSHFVINTMNAYQNYHFFKLMPYGKKQVEFILFAIPMAVLMLYLRRYINFSPLTNIVFYSSAIYSFFLIWAYIRNPILFRKMIKRQH